MAARSKGFFPVWFLEEVYNSLQRLFTATNLKEIKSIADLTKFSCEYSMSSSLHYIASNSSVLFTVKKENTKKAI